MNEIKNKIMSLKDNKNYTYILMGGIVIFVCFLVIIYFTFFYTKKISYSKMRDNLKNAAVKYCDENCSSVLKNNSITIPAKTLMDNGYMSSFQKMSGDKNISCDGSVTINKGGDGYNYITNLNCGTNYTDVSLVDYLKKKVNTVENGDGLYSIGDDRVYRGEYVDNYIKINDILFRILKVNSDNTITLVLSDYNRNTLRVWDDRYNSVVSRNDGINDYNISRAYNYLHEVIDDNYSNVKKKAIIYDYCIGKRTSSSNSLDYSEECSNTNSDFVSLLNVNDFLMGSIDSKCLSVDDSVACQNYNYLTDYSGNFWFVTASKSNTNKVYYYNGYEIVETRASASHSLRFVITISGNEIYSSGDGTLDNPYILK